MPALDVVGLTRAFINRSMLDIGKDGLVTFPKITIKQTSAIGWWDAAPQQATGDLATVADGIGHDLAGAATQREPHPTLIFLSADERPQFIEFQHVRISFWRPGLR